jgi:site-specific recombinase XerD
MGSTIMCLKTRKTRIKSRPWLTCATTWVLHMLRHACGFKLANDGHDTRAIQHYLGHRNIQHTVRYTELAPDRFNGFWKD